MNKKYLAIDYGSKKIGLAKSDENGEFAFPYKIILNKDKENSLKEILEIIDKEKIDKIIFGESVNLKGEKNNIWEEMKDFVDLLSLKINIEINFEKEWLSTVEARRFQDRKDADDSAAAIILQRYLDRVNRV